VSVNKLLSIIRVIINFVLNYFLARQSTIQLQRKPKHKDTAKTNQDNNNNSIENKRNKEVDLT